MTLSERLEIRQQPKRQADALALLGEFQHSPYVAAMSWNELERLLQAHSVRFFYDGDTLAGLAAWEVIQNGPWVEIGPFYVSEAYRGQGLGSLMFDAVEAIQRDAGHKLYGVTKNPVVKQMFARRGFRQVSVWSLPRGIQRHLLSKLTARKLATHLRKLRPGDSVSHFVKPGDQ